MKATNVLILVLTLLALAIVPGAAAPSAGPCTPGAVYDPACDVNHDGTVNVLDIQLAAGHWNQSGPWVSDNNHNHLGQTWTGSNNPLKLSGSYGAPDYASLVLSNAVGAGLLVSSAGGTGNGVSVNSVGGNGVFVNWAGNNGVFVESTLNDGVVVSHPGRNGVVVGPAGGDGVIVGLTGGHGLVVGDAGDDGVRIRDAVDDGIQVGEDNDYPTYGLYVPSPGTSGTALLPNTANAAGEWALYTLDNIEAGNVMLGSLSLLAVVGGDAVLTPGDVVATAGLADPLPGSQPHLPQVRLASNEHASVIGVVSSRMVLQPLPGKEGEQELHSADGPAQPGDYVALTVLGAAQVKVDRTAAIAAGQRLTLGDRPGQVRALRTFMVQLADGHGTAGMLESAPVIGVALAAPHDGVVWVMVNP